MPDIALPRQLRAIGQRAIDEAVMRRSSVVGAEHVLLAIAADPESIAAQVLARSDLDYIGIATALGAERKRSLAIADVRPIDPSALASAPRTTQPSWGASVREVLRAAEKPAARTGGTEALEAELTIGILRAELGTVPRMLAIAGVDRRTIIERLRVSQPARSR